MSEIVVDKELFTHLTETIDDLNTRDSVSKKLVVKLKKTIEDLENAKKVADLKIKKYEDSKINELKKDVNTTQEPFDPEYWNKGLCFWKMTADARKLIIQEYINKKSQKKEYKIVC